jgi:hypothetical protein
MRPTPHYSLQSLTRVVCIAILFFAPSGRCNANGEEQVELVENTAPRFETLIAAARKYADVLASIHDASSGNSALSKLQEASRVFRRELANITVLAKEMQRKSANAALRINPANHAPGKAPSDRTVTLPSEWTNQAGRITNEAKRIFALKGISSAFWDVFIVDIHRLLVAVYDFAIASSNEIPRGTDSQVRESLALFETHGPRKVVRISLGMASEIEVEKAAAALRESLLGKVSVVIGNDLGTAGRAILIAPADRLEEVSKAISFGDVIETEVAPRRIVVQPRSATVTAEEIEHAIQILTDNGQFQLDIKMPDIPTPRIAIPGGFPIPRTAQPQNTFQGSDVLRQAVREVGFDCILTLDLTGLSRQEFMEFEKFIYWNKLANGKFFMSVNNRCFLFYRRSASEFANTVRIGRVARIDEGKRRIAIEVEAEKVTPKALLEYGPIRDDPIREDDRARLHHAVTVQRLDELAKKQGTSLGVEITHSFNLESAMAKAITADANTNRSFADQMRDNSRRELKEKATGPLGRTQMTEEDIARGVPREFVERYNQNLDEMRRRLGVNGRADPSLVGERRPTIQPKLVLGEFKLPEPSKALSQDEVREIVDMLYYEGDWLLRGNIQLGAMRVLVRVHPDTVTDREMRSRIAKGFRQLGLDNAFRGDSEIAIQGLIIWGGRYCVPILIEMLRQEGHLPSDAMMRGLTYFKDSSAAEAVAGHVGSTFDEAHHKAVAALREMGPVAEDVLIKMAPARDPKASLAAVELLGDVGTVKSLPLLKRAAASGNPAVREAAEASTKKIQERQRATDGN